MIKRFSALLLMISMLLVGCDMEKSQEVTSKIEKTTHVASVLKQDVDTSVNEFKNTLNSELQKAKDDALIKTKDVTVSGLTHIEGIKQKAEVIGNMKVSELLSLNNENNENNENEDNW